MGELSLDDQGAARMVDVSAKPETERVATAGTAGRLRLQTLGCSPPPACPRATPWPSPGSPASWGPSGPPS